MTYQPPLLLDTDILSAVMRRQPLARARAAAYLSVYKQFSFSIITRYEILRGLKVKNAAKQRVVFERLCAASEIMELTDSSIIQAAELYAHLHRQGMLIGDADILIAATALASGYGVVTNNERHFQRIPGLRVENWLK